MLYYTAPNGGDLSMLGGMREEEGPAIFSKHPVVRSGHLLLPRHASDGEDGHQRAVLHAEVRVPGFGGVDVYSTHLSLSGKARRRATPAIIDFTKLGRGRAQVPSQVRRVGNRPPA
jgi:endonuclease/exonuclease/phosphatase family metal-dependent hydrolase